MRRIARALEAMVEDGFTTFILYIEYETPFLAPAIDAITALRSRNSAVHFEIVLPYQVEDNLAVFPTEGAQFYDFCRQADAVSYNQPCYICGYKSTSYSNLLARCSAAIIFCDTIFVHLPQLIYTLNRNRYPIICIAT